jgi:hypothetical protein
MNCSVSVGFPHRFCPRSVHFPAGGAAMSAVAGCVEYPIGTSGSLSKLVQDKLRLVLPGAWDVIADRQRTPDLRELPEMEAE